MVNVDPIIVIAALVFGFLLGALVATPDYEVEHHSAPLPRNELPIDPLPRMGQ